MLVVRKDVYEGLCDFLGIEKAGFPVDTRHGNYVKVADNPALWEYIPLTKPKEGENERRVRLANKVTTIPKTPDNQVLMNVNTSDYKTKGLNYIKNLNAELAKNDYYCHVNGKKIKYITPHIYTKRHSLDSQIDRTKVLPYIMDILTDKRYGTKGKFTEDSRGDYREIVGKAEVKDKSGAYTKVGIAVIVADDGKGSSEVKGISVFVVRNRLIKSVPTDAFTGNQHNIRSDFQ